MVRVILLLLILFYFSCTLTNKVNTPFFTSGNESIISGSYQYPFGLDIEFAHSFKDSTAVISGFHYHSEGYGLDIGYGIFGLDGFYREFYGGIGFGRDKEFSMVYYKPFVQGGIGYNTEHFGIGIFVQANGRIVNQYDFDTDKHYVFFAPYGKGVLALTLGFKWLQIGGQLGVALPLHKGENLPQEINYPVIFPFTGTLGISFRFSKE